MRLVFPQSITKFIKFICLPGACPFSCPVLSKINDQRLRWSFLSIALNRGLGEDTWKEAVVWPKQEKLSQILPTSAFYHQDGEKACKARLPIRIEFKVLMHTHEVFPKVESEPDSVSSRLFPGQKDSWASNLSWQSWNVSIGRDQKGHLQSPIQSSSVFCIRICQNYAWTPPVTGSSLFQRQLIPLPDIPDWVQNLFPLTSNSWS